MFETHRRWCATELNVTHQAKGQGYDGTVAYDTNEDDVADAVCHDAATGCCISWPVKLAALSSIYHSGVRYYTACVCVFVLCVCVCVGVWGLERVGLCGI